MKAIQKSLLALALAVAFTTANATPVDWTLSNVAFNASGGWTQTISGSFTFDADTGTYSNGSFTFVNGPYSGTFSISSGTQTSLFLTTNGAKVVLTFDALTNDGGTAVIEGSSNWNVYNLLKSGTLVGVPKATASAVPEPEAYALMLAGLGLVGFAARRKLG